MHSRPFQVSQSNICNGFFLYFLCRNINFRLCRRLLWGAEQSSPPRRVGMLPNDALPSPPLVPGSSARWSGLLIAGLASLSRSSLRLSRGANSLPRDLVLPSYLDCRDDLPQYVRHRRITRKVIAQQWIRLSDRSFPRRQSEDRDDGPPESRGEGEMHVGELAVRTI